MFKNKEKAEARRAKRKRDASLATKKFNFEDMVNGDPRCELSDLKVARYYLRFANNFEIDPVYASTIDLQAATGLSPAAITASRARLVTLGHFVPAGRTKKRIDLYILSLRRELEIRDYVETERQRLVDLDAERKRKQQQKRAQRAPIVMSPVCITAHVCDFTEPREVISFSRDNLLDDHLDPISSEEEDTFASSINGHANAPYPVPPDESSAILLISELLEGKRAIPALVMFLQRKLIGGDLRPSHISNLKDAA